jgi:nucleotide-binding universal stress UspA family protein
VFPTKTLLAVDGSPESTRGGQIAGRLSSKLGSELHLVSVGAMLEGYTPWDWKVLDASSLSRVRQLAEEEAKATLEKQTQKLREEGAEVAEAHVKTGRPAVEIVRLAEELDAGLVILGSRGFGSLKRALLGSVSYGVVCHAHASVLVVRGEEEDHPWGKVLLTVDGSREAAAAAKAAVEISGASGSELHVLSVLRSPYPGPGMWDVSGERLERAKRDLRAFAERPAGREKAKGSRVEEVHLAFGNPDKEIVALGERLDVGLVVVGSRGLGGARRALLGSVSDSVVRHAHCSVLVVRGAGKQSGVGSEGSRLLSETDEPPEA